ncbi:unnamed protein product [Danaus chrysippus]|uniref:(African queen) hypothetical protein n=1 Tax=Danaus chrysippus TaxID=151541 RepID=A0A8J2R1I5_9NEOP|nr:unnamed protein product [Danaus chrysippus]
MSSREPRAGSLIRASHSAVSSRGAAELLDRTRVFRDGLIGRSEAPQATGHVCLVKEARGWLADTPLETN